MKPKVLVIVGPTASGKTSLALKVASLLPRCSIISVDARQAYKELSILTGKDIPKRLPKGTNIYGSDLLDTGEEVNIASFVKKVKPIIKDNLANGTPLILVGGSGLYIKALTSDLSDIYIPPDQELRDKLSHFSLDGLQRELKKINAQLFDQLNNSDRNNPRRLIRHIEKCLSSKKPSTPTPPLAQFNWIGLNLSKATQKKLIEKRVRERIKQGAVQEVKAIRKAYPKTKSPLFTSLGVKEITSYLNGDITQTKLVSLWTQSEVGYVRRQNVWFKKQASIIWYDESKDREVLAQELARDLKKQK